ncbi:MAG: hypothetical protein ACOYMA_07545 [Bacteroidia bacterium]
MDGKLFESLKPNVMSNLASFVGGWSAETCVNNEEDTWKQATSPFDGDQLTEEAADTICTTIAADGFVLDGHPEGDPMHPYDPGM